MFSDLFYNAAFKDEPIEKHKIPYQNTFLPALKLQPEGQKKGAIMIHGGFDSFKAAAFEPRIKRVIASSVVFDYLQIPPAFVSKFVKVLMKKPKMMN